MSPLKPYSVVLMFAALGCSHQRVALSEGPREYVAGSYPAVLERWTRSAQLTSMEEVDNVFTVTATYEAWDFRWAYVIRYAHDYRLTVEQRSALLQESLAETREAHHFYLALYAQNPKWSDLLAKDPAWIVRLVDDKGTETAPSRIELIRKPGALYRTYFPYTTPWRTAYRIQFPRLREDGRPSIARNARYFGLRFAGAQGNQEITWETISNGDSVVSSTSSEPKAAL